MAAALHRAHHLPHVLVRRVAVEPHLIEQALGAAGRIVELQLASLVEIATQLDLAAVDRDLVDRRVPRQLTQHSEADAGHQVFERGGALAGAPALDRLVGDEGMLAESALLELVLHEPHAGPHDQAAGHHLARDLVLRAEMDLAELRSVDQLTSLAHREASSGAVSGSSSWRHLLRQSSTSTPSASATRVMKLNQAVSCTISRTWRSEKPAARRLSISARAIVQDAFVSFSTTANMVLSCSLSV